MKEWVNESELGAPPLGFHITLEFSDPRTSLAVV
jgi:hypothetical protein